MSKSKEAPLSAERFERLLCRLQDNGVRTQIEGQHGEVQIWRATNKETGENRAFVAIISPTRYAIYISPDTYSITDDANALMRAVGCEP